MRQPNMHIQHRTLQGMSWIEKLPKLQMCAALILLGKTAPAEAFLSEVGATTSSKQEGMQLERRCLCPGLGENLEAKASRGGAQSPKPEASRGMPWGLWVSGAPETHGERYRKLANRRSERSITCLQTSDFNMQARQKLASIWHRITNPASRGSRCKLPPAHPSLPTAEP